MKALIENGLTVTEFLHKHFNSLLKVAVDSPETGDYRLLETEADVASRYEANDHRVYSIMASNDPDFDIETIEEGINTSPMCCGYFVMQIGE